MLKSASETVLARAQGGGRTLFTRPAVGTALRIEQFTTTTCRRISGVEPAIVLVKRGRKIARNAGAEIVAEDGMAAVFPAGFEADIVNETDAGGAYQALSIVFSAEALAAQPSVTPALQQITALGVLDAGFGEAIGHAVEAICDTSLPDSIALHRITELLVWLEHVGVRLTCPAQSDVVAQVKQLFGAAPDAPWSAPEVAGRLNMSEATLRRRLARSGTSLSRILLEARMLTALTLLQAGDQTILQVSEAVGYNSPSHFAARFRQRFGFAPSTLR